MNDPFLEQAYFLIAKTKYSRQEFSEQPVEIQALILKISQWGKEKYSQGAKISEEDD